MACDIHVFIEYNEYEEWWPHCKPRISRDYELFGLMAGVRNDTAMFSPRGVPDGFSYPGYHATSVNNPDFHTHSWLTTAELEQVIARTTRSNRSIKAALAAMKELEPARIVFWFDN